MDFPHLFVPNEHGGILVVPEGVRAFPLQQPVSFGFDNPFGFGRESGDGGNGMVRSPGKVVLCFRFVVLDALFDDGEPEANA